MTISIITTLGPERVEIVVVNLIMYCVPGLSVFSFNARAWLEIPGNVKNAIYQLIQIMHNQKEKHTRYFRDDGPTICCF